MSKLSDAQLVILSAACNHAHRFVLPLPKSLKGGAANKVIASLIGRGLIEEAEANVTRGDPVWREAGGRPATLVATDAACALIDAGSEAAQEAPQRPTRAKAAKGAAKPQAKRKTRPKAATPAKPARQPKQRDGTKQARLIAMLERPRGATVAEIADAFGWQAHTVRGALAGALKKKLGLAIVSEKNEQRGRVYRIKT